MLDTQTKRRIDDCRDILVGKLPDPKAQIEQITIGLIYKFMDDMDKEAIELGGAAKFFSADYEKFAWDNLFDTKVTATEMLGLYSKAIESMDKNPNIPQLFRDIFKNAYLPYRDPETLKMFLKTIGKFEYTHSEKLGDAFEYLLSIMGSQGDAGQFRTPRHIIDFLVAIVDPDIGESILDPACGTAGFLISAYKHILLKHTKANKEGLDIYAYNNLENKEFNNLGDKLTPDNRKRLIQDIAGYDISPDMVRLSLVNLYLHGFPDPEINEYDTLSSEERWKENFDVVLANPPFMSPKGGIRPHKRFTIASNRSEVLFVDYIAEHLTPKGKAGIIVPEGVIFQSGKAYKDLRKMLVDNYLYAVVSLPAGVFNPYSGVKTSILLMDRNIAKKRNDILFVKIDNDGYNLGAQRAAVKGGQLEEAIDLIKAFRNDKSSRHAEPGVHAELVSVSPNTIAHAVLKTDIAANGDYNLSGERYKSQVQLQTDFPIIDFEDSIEKVVYSNKIKRSDYRESGSYPVVDQSDKFIAGYWDNEEDVFKITKPITLFGDHTRCFKYIDFDFVLGADGVKILQPSEEFNPKFYYYLIRDIQINNLGYSRHFKELKDKKIPLPPLSIQEEIVAEIESYQKIIDCAKAIVENYKPRIDIDPDWEMVELGKHCFVKAGGTPLRSNSKFWEEGNIPWYSSGELNDIYTTYPKEYITEKGLNCSSASFFSKGSLLIGMYDTAAFKMSILDRDGTFNQAVCGIKPNDKFDMLFLLLYFMMNKEEYLRHRVGVRQRNLNKGFISAIKIPLIPLEVQLQIVSQIEKEQELVNANKQLIEIFEQKIKDRIAKVWGEEKEQEESFGVAAEPKGEYR